MCVPEGRTSQVSNYTRGNAEVVFNHALDALEGTEEQTPRSLNPAHQQNTPIVSSATCSLA